MTMQYFDNYAFTYIYYVNFHIQILQTPGLWETDNPQGFSLTDLSNAPESSCSGYCSMI